MEQPFFPEIETGNTYLGKIIETSQEINLP